MAETNGLNPTSTRYLLDTNVVLSLIRANPLGQWLDTTYRLTLKEKTLGLKKVVIGLKAADGERLLELPVVWNRVPFLSSSPARAFVGPYAVRVFLRCPDESVELTRVLSAPAGIKAVVSSTREVTVVCSAEAAAVVDGEIKVATTAESYPPLRIPVARFSMAGSADRSLAPEK